LGDKAQMCFSSRQQSKATVVWMMADNNYLSPTYQVGNPEELGTASTILRYSKIGKLQAQREVELQNKAPLGTLY